MFKKNIAVSAVSILCAACLSHAQFTYLDADTNNTTLADGSAFSPNLTAGATVVQDEWKERAFGNELSVFASDAGSDSPALRTTIDGLVAGQSYFVSAYFWVAGDGTPGGNQEWDISAGLSESGISGFRYDDQDVMQITDSSHFDSSVVISESDRRLFEVDLGTAFASGAGEIQVFVDDLPGNDDRTWYDGVGTAVPEPSTLSLLGLCGLLIALRRRSA